MEPSQTPADFTQPTPPTPTGVAPLPIKHHHKPMLIFTLLLIVITGLIASYFLFFTPQSQALNKATETIKLLSDADENKLNSLAQADDPFIKNFYQSVRSQVQSSSYTIIDKKVDNSTYYFLFELQGSASKYLRIIVEKADEWKVTSITHSQQKLPLVPQDYTADEEPAEAIATRVDAGFTCLVQSDYALTNFNPTEQDFLQWSSIYEPTSSVANKSASIFFKLGTTEEEGFADFYTTWARFSDDMTAKQWLFRIRPNVNEKSIGTVREHQDKLSAYERANKIKQALLNKSVPVERIVIVDPLLSATEYTDENEPILRRVEMIIDPTCVIK